MAVTLRLKKPLYKWQYERGLLRGDYVLRSDVIDWLAESQVGYRCFTTEEYGDDGRTFLYYHIKIDDEDTAMLFKLTWL